MKPCLNIDNDIVKSVDILYLPAEYLVVTKALSLLCENEECHMLDRATAKAMLDEFDKEMENG